jgi:hypothetical protein
MGTTLIFVGQWVVTDLVCCSSLSDWVGIEEVPGNSSHIRPYPKPTQVDWQSMLRRLRELC